MINFRFFRSFCLVLFVLVLIFPAAFVPLYVARAQDDLREKMRRVLTEDAGFSDQQLKYLENGEIVIRRLEQDDPGEVAFIGAVRLEAPRDIVFDAFRRAVETQEKDIATERGVFSDPPVPKDLSNLKFTNSEIGTLSSCKVGECEWSLPEEMIEKLAREVDWETSAGRQKAGDLLKEMLAGYTAEYLRKGDSALMIYKDDPEPLSLQEEQRILLGKLLWIDDFAPEFKEYLKDFPPKSLKE